jgi:hypothetical protein
MFITCGLRTYHPHSKISLPFFIYLWLAATITLLENERRRVTKMFLFKYELSTRSSAEDTGMVKRGLAKYACSSQSAFFVS